MDKIIINTDFLEKRSYAGLWQRWLYTAGALYVWPLEEMSHYDKIDDLESEGFKVDPNDMAAGYIEGDGDFRADGSVISSKGAFEKAEPMLKAWLVNNPPPMHEEQDIFETSKVAQDSRIVWLIDWKGLFYYGQEGQHHIDINWAGDEIAEGDVYNGVLRVLNYNREYDINGIINRVMMEWPDEHAIKDVKVYESGLDYHRFSNELPLGKKFVWHPEHGLGVVNSTINHPGKEPAYGEGWSGHYDAFNTLPDAVLSDTYASDGWVAGCIGEGKCEMMGWGTLDPAAHTAGALADLHRMGLIDDDTEIRNINYKDSELWRRMG
jgi:hypothetical protein